MVTNFGGFGRAPAQQEGSGLPQLRVQPSPRRPAAAGGTRPAAPSGGLPITGLLAPAGGPRPAALSQSLRPPALRPPPPAVSAPLAAAGESPGPPLRTPLPHYPPGCAAGKRARRHPQPYAEVPPGAPAAARTLAEGGQSPAPGFQKRVPLRRHSSREPAVRPLPAAATWPRVGEGAAPPPPGAAPGRGREKPRRRPRWRRRGAGPERGR